MGQVLTLAEIESFDSRPFKSGDERRYSCLLCGQNKPRDRAHKSLSLNSDTGAFFCHRCQAKGVIKERWAPREFAPRKQRAKAALARVFGVSDTVRVSFEQKAIVTPESSKKTIAEDNKETLVKRLRNENPLWQSNFASSAAQSYLKMRGIEAETAQACGIGYAPAMKHWEKDPSGEWQLIGTDRRAMFPIINREGELVAVHARAIDDQFINGNKLTRGDKSLGLFQTPGALQSETIAICEGAIDALSLYSCGLSAVALTGTSFPDWLPDALAFRQVLIATDADDAGDTAAEKITMLLRSRGARAVRLRPAGAKDWNEVLIKIGLDAMRREITKRTDAAFTYKFRVNCDLEVDRPTPAICPFCSVELKKQVNEVLNVLFCPFGCSFSEVGFVDESEAVCKIIERMFEWLTYDELQAIGDAIDERAAILICNLELDDQAAVVAAQHDILPPWVEKFLKFNSP